MVRTTESCNNQQQLYSCKPGLWILSLLLIRISKKGLFRTRSKHPDSPSLKKRGLDLDQKYTFYLPECRVVVMNCRNLKPTSQLRRTLSTDLATSNTKFNRNSRYCTKCGSEFFWTDPDPVIEKGSVSGSLFDKALIRMWFSEGH